MSNIRDPADYRSSFWDWSPFNECFEPTKIRITDIDGFVERKGVFLLIETKRPGVIIPRGQNIMFNKMIDSGLFTVLIIWGKTNRPQEVLKISSNGKQHFKNCDTRQLKNIIKEWFDYATNLEELPGKIDRMQEVIDLAFEIQKRYLTGQDLSILSGAIVQKVYAMRDKLLE